MKFKSQTGSVSNTANAPNANPKYYYQALKLECLKLAYSALGDGLYTQAPNHAKELYRMITGEYWDEETKKDQSEDKFPSAARVYD